ncbi:hypothetical protein MTR_4g088720 [Medicago truncatula]|uniref:Uncharacterized protein n=1 Tax=Medicago truncatula TaxID=3880 RepID=A0A072UPS5_MEDTR|nr:hypothetical protein MTR_4g088720 [Medicago truncatula]
MVFHRWPFIDKGLVENFQGFYERSMRMEPRYNEVRMYNMRMTILYKNGENDHQPLD